MTPEQEGGQNKSVGSAIGRLPERTVAGLHEALATSLPPYAKCAHVLDLGCGTGAWLQRLQDAGFCNLTGIDADLSQLGVKGVRAIEGDLNQEEIGLQSETFDLITAVEVIEHLDNPGRLLHHAGKHLAPGGCLIMTTPNIQSIHARLRFLLTGRMGQFDQKADPTHVMPVYLLSFERLLARHDLVLLRRWGYPRIGSIMYRPALSLAGRLLKAILPEEVPGDVLCMQVGRKSEHGRWPDLSPRET